MSYKTKAQRHKLVRPDANTELASLPAAVISTKWDKSSKTQRSEILATFVERFHSSTAAEIERHFGNGAQLFFARITATMRLNYKMMAVHCDRFGILLLMSIGLFLQGQKFLTNFAEIGGIQLLCDFVASIVNCSEKMEENADVLLNKASATIASSSSAAAISASSPSPTKKFLSSAGGGGLGTTSTPSKTNPYNNKVDSPSFVPETTMFQGNNKTSSSNQSLESRATLEAAAKTRAIRLLIHIANSGRVYREMVCEDGGLQHLVNATSFETNDGVLELIGSLFLSLGHGNPRRVRDVHAALLHIARTGNDSAALCAASTLRALQVARIAPSVGSGTQPQLGMLLPESGGGQTQTQTGTTTTTATSPGSAGRSRIKDVAEFSDDVIAARTKQNMMNVTTGGSEATESVAGGEGTTSSTQQIEPSQIPPHLAGNIISPIHLVEPPSSLLAAQAAEQEAGLVLYLDSLFHLLRSPSIRVRFEGIELLSLSAPGKGMLTPMLRRCVDILDDVDTTLHAIAALPYERERAFIHLHASCVRLLYALMTHKDETVSLETLRVFELRLLHLCLGRFLRVTQDAHNRSMLSQSLKTSANNSLLRTTAAPTAAPGVQDAVRIFKVLLTADGLAEESLAVAHVDRVRRTVESWLRKTLGDEAFAPLLDPSSSLHDPYVISIATKLSEENRKQLEAEEKHEAALLAAKEEEEQNEKSRKQSEEQEQEDEDEDEEQQKE